MTPIPNVLQEGPRPVHQWLLKQENQVKIGEFCGPCPCPNVQVQGHEDGSATCSGKCADKDGNLLGQLTFEDIRRLLRERVVRQFNHSRFPEITMDRSEVGGIYVRRPGHPEYTFNEYGAPEAVLVGDRLTMPDAQGFPCIFHLA